MIFNRKIPSFMRESYHYDSLSAIVYAFFLGLAQHFFPVVVRRLGASSFQMALIISAPFLGALFSIYWARLSRDVASQMNFYVRVKLLSLAVILFAFLGINPWILISIVIFSFLLEPAANPAYARIMKEIYPDNYRGRAMGYVRMERAIAAVFAAYLGGLLLDRFSYRYIFPLGAVFGIISIVYFSKIKTQKKDTKRKRRKQGILLKEILEIFKKDRPFALFVVIFFLQAFACLMITPLYPILLVDYLGASNSFVGKLVSLATLFLIFSYLFWGRYIDKKGACYSLALNFFIRSFVPLFYFFSSTIWYIIPARIIDGLTTGAHELSRIHFITNRAKGEDISSYQGIDFTSQGIRGIVAPFFGVFLMRWIGMRSVFIISSCLIVTCSLAMFLLGRYYSLGSSSSSSSSSSLSISEPRT